MIHDQKSILKAEAIPPDSGELIAAVTSERRRQVEKLGYDLRHDVALGGSELRVMAQNYAAQATSTALVKALALLWAAEDADQYCIQVQQSDALRCECPGCGSGDTGDTVVLHDQYGQVVSVELCGRSDG